jgi:hypothetical protein
MAHTLRKANAGSFKPGNPGGPGRPVGARSKLNELAVALLHEDFAKHGADVIRRVRERKPEVYLASVVSLLPKQSQIEKRSPFDDLTDAELDQLEEYIAGMRAKTVTQLELVANNEEAAVQLSAEEKDATQPIHEAK